MIEIVLLILGIIITALAVYFFWRWQKEVKKSHELEIQVEKFNSMDEYADKFTAISQKVLDIQVEKTDKEIYNTISPLQDNVDKFRNKIEDYMKDNSNIKTTLMAKFENLDKSVNTIDAQARELTEALKGSTKTRGDWGEYILESVLDSAGLTKEQNYALQATYEVDGKRYRPDAVIKLPENRNIIIDAKVGLIHYQNYLNAETDEAKETEKKNFLNGIAKQVEECAKYQNIKEINSPGFVIMFIPITSAWELLHQVGAKIIEDAAKKSVLIVSPTNLLAILKIVQNFWSSYKQAENLHEIAKLAENVHAAVYRLIDNVDNSLKSSEKLTDNINKIKKTIESPRGVLRYAKKLEDYGFESNKKLPDVNYIDKVIEENEKV